MTGKRIYFRGETRRHRLDAERLVAHVEAGRLPDQQAMVAMLLDRWMEAVDHELSILGSAGRRSQAGSREPPEHGPIGMLALSAASHR